MPRAFVGIGSNIDPARNVAKALRLLGRRARLRAISTVYATAPIGRPEQEQYYNCVAEIETPLPPLRLKIEVLAAVEQDLGRVRSEDKFAPRAIDLDLLVYDDLKMETADLTLPDPDIAARPFLALGLRELAPDLDLAPPVVAPDDDEAKPLAEYTAGLRKELFDGPEP